MTELLLAEGMFLCSLRLRSFSWLRIAAGVAAAFLFSWLFPAYSDSPAYLSFMFFTLFVFTVCITKFIFKESWLKLAFCCVAGYTVQHLAYQFNNISLIAMLGDTDTTMRGGMYGNDFDLVGKYGDLGNFRGRRSGFLLCDGDDLLLDDFNCVCDKSCLFLFFACPLEAYEEQAE